MSVVITGSESFLANYLKKIIKKKKINHFGIDYKKSKTSSQCDINDKNLYKFIPDKTKTIIHLAAISSSKDFKRNPKKAFEINVNGTFNLINAARIKKVKQIIFASSEWVYGEFSTKKINEKENIDPNNLGSEYALSKFIGENIIKFYCKLYGINYIIFRFGIIYGPRFSSENWSAVESIAYKVFKRDKKVIVGSGKTARTFIYAEDVARAIVKSINSKKEGVYNLSGDRLITLNDIFKTSKKLLNRKTKFMEKDKKKFNFRNTDNRLIKKTFNWKPIFNFNKGMNRIIESFKNIDDKKNNF